MQNDGETINSLLDVFQNIETQTGLLAGLELISAVACADSDSQRVDTCACNKLLDLCGIGEACIFSSNIDIVFDTGQLAQLAFNNNASCVRIVNDLLCQSDVILG